MSVGGGRFASVVVIFLLLDFSISSVWGYTRLYRGRDRGDVWGECPSQCQCMILNQRGTREIPERWGPAPFQTANIQGDSPSVYGRRMICQGLRRLPKPIPHDVTKLTVFGDSSTRILVAPPDSPNIQNDDSREYSADTQIRYITRVSFNGNYRMTELTLSGNNIGILYPNIFQPLKSLNKMTLTNNNIRHLSAAVFNGLSSLETLQLNDNMIRFLPQLIFGDLENLKVLKLNGNKLRRLPRDIFKPLKQLAVLDLSRNNLTDLQDDVFDSNDNLQELLLNGNRLFRIRPRWFQRLHSLRILSLRGNGITVIEESSFSSLYNLEELLVSANHISEVQANSFMNLRDLKVLDLATNDIQSINSDCFRDLDYIQELFLASNKIYSIENDTFKYMRSLKRLDLSRNLIANLETGALRILNSLQYLDIGHNKLNKIPSRFVYGLTELKEISFDNNYIRSIESEAFMTTGRNLQSKLASVSLQHNAIREISAVAFSGVTEIKNLNLASNKLKRIHTLGLSGFHNIRQLDLSSNKIRDLNNGVFSNLRTIENLKLANNKIRRVRNSMMSGMMALKELDLSSNSITEISPGAFRRLDSLVELNLKQNKLLGFNFSYITNLPALTVVDLRENFLFWVDTTGNLQLRLRELLLGKNNLNTVTRDVSAIMGSPSILDISGNPLQCDCNLKWLLDSNFRRSIQLDMESELKCKLPNRLHGRSVISLSESEMSCDAEMMQDTKPSFTCDDSHFQMKSIFKNRKGERVAMNRHVTLIDTQRDETVGNGVLLDNNWILTSSDVVPASDHVMSPPKFKVRIGRDKESRKVIQAIRHPLTTWRQYNIALLRLETSNMSSTNEKRPCMMIEKQYDMISRIYPRYTITTRIGSKRNKLKARRGKTPKSCKYPSYLCVKIGGKSKSENMLLRGSPVYLGYAGDLNLAGIGLGDWSQISPSSEPLFIPVWHVEEWVNDVTHQYDTKCSGSSLDTKQCLQTLNLPRAADLLAKIQKPENH